MIRRINGINLRVPSRTSLGASIGLASVSPGDVIANEIYVKADTLKTGDVIRLRTSWTKTGTTDAATFKLYWNSSLSTSGATLLGTYTLAAANRMVSWNRRMCFLSPSSAIVVIPSTSLATSDGDQALTLSTLSVTNWLTTDGYFFTTVTTQNLRLTDSVNCLYISLEL
jgi:hypothetical protein